MVYGKTEYNEESKLIYMPKYQETQMEKFRMFVERKFGLKLDDYWKFHEWTCQNFPEFWECVWQFFGIVYSQPYEEVFDRNRSFDDMEWFKGARLNYAENIFKYKDSHIAIIATDPTDNEESITYKQMYEEVCQYAATLRNMGVKKGDCVGCYMSNKKEAVFAFLATASMGALWCGALPLQGVKSALARFQQVSPKVIFTSGNFSFEGKEIKMLEKLKELSEGLPSLRKLVFIPSKTPGIVEDIAHIPKCCTLREFLNKAHEEYNVNPWDLEYEQVPFDHPLNISFTSGTTGLPKIINHSTGAYFASLKDYGLHQNITRKDVLINFSPVGWISWNMFVNTLHLGVTLCLYEGHPFEESPTRFWDLIDHLGLTSIYIWSSTAENMEKRGFVPTEKHSLKSLRQIFGIGSIMKPKTFEFFQTIRPGIFAQSGYGTTEVYGLISGLNQNLPVYKGEIHCFSLGMDVKCLDEKGKEITGKRGSLAIANPFPALPVCLLEEEKKKVRETYLTQYPGYWHVGDDVWINPITKGFIVFGRCDETLNPKGARFNCSEIYFALDQFPGIMDCVCVSQYNKEMDERVVLFVKMKSGNALTHQVKTNIRDLIEKTLTYEHVPDVIIQVPDIPYNMTGKKLNITVKKIINKMPVTNSEFVINPASLEFYRNLDLGDF